MIGTVVTTIICAADAIETARFIFDKDKTDYNPSSVIAVKCIKSAVETADDCIGVTRTIKKVERDVKDGWHEIKSSVKHMFD